MLHVYLVRKDNKYYVRLMKKTDIISESDIGMSIDRAVQFGNDMVDAFINSGMNVEPALGLTEEYRGE